MKKKNILGITLSLLISLTIFLLIIGILNIINFNNEIALQILNFLNQNIGIIILFSLLFYLGELFSIFIFPLNIPTPIFNALGGVLLVKFIFGIFNTIEKTTNQPIFQQFKSLEPLAISLTFILIIFIGYLIIISDLCNSNKKYKRKDREIKRERHNLSQHHKKL